MRSREGRPNIRCVDDIIERVTEVLRRVDISDPDQADELLGLVYEDLRALAARQMRREHRDRTLQPTALVHEAYIRLAAGAPVDWEGRAHFLRVAGRAMRQVLVDEARRRTAAKRGGAGHRVTLEPDMLSADGGEHDFLDLHRALERLGALDPELEKLVELRFFAGLTVDDAATALGVSPRKAAKDWAAARLWLSRELGMR